MSPTHMIPVPDTTRQRLAQAIAGFRLAERDAGQAIARLSYTYALVRTRHQLQP